MGHARALAALGASDQIQIANQVVAKGLSVRQTEVLVQKYRQEVQEAIQPSLPSVPVVRSEVAEWAKVEERMAESWGTKVQVKRSGEKGVVCIHYSSLDAFNSLLDHWNIRVE
jgi:ParB family chromosome partitioning protein